MRPVLLTVVLMVALSASAAAGTFSYGGSAYAGGSTVNVGIYLKTRIHGDLQKLGLKQRPKNVRLTVGARVYRATLVGYAIPEFSFGYRAQHVKIPRVWPDPLSSVRPV